MCIDHGLGRGRVDKLRDTLPGALVLPGGALGEGVDAAMDVGVVALVVIVQRVDDHARLLRRGGIVEIHQWFAVDFLSEQRKVVADFLQLDAIEDFDHPLRTTLS